MKTADKIKHYRTRILQELSLRSGYALSKPTGCIALLTNRCNARCVHCHSWKLPKGQQELSTAEWENTLDQLRSWLGPVFLSLTGGETLIKKDALHLARYASSKGFWTEFLTNGYLMDCEKAGILIQSGVKRIKVSLDGSIARIHDLIRGRDGFYEHAVGALKMLAEEKKRDPGNTTIIWAKTSIMSYNINDLSNIAEMAKELGICGVEYQALEPVYYTAQLRDRKWYLDHPLWIKDLQEAMRAIDKIKTMKSKGFPIVNSQDNLDLIKAYFQDPGGLAYKVHSHEYKKKKPKCSSWIGGFQVMPDGGLKMCHFMEPFAYVKDGKIKELWRERTRCWKTECGYILC